MPARCHSRPKRWGSRDQPQAEQVQSPRRSRAGSTRWPQRRQFVPLSSTANGSAKPCPTRFGERGFDARASRPSATGVSTGGATGRGVGGCGDDAHPAMTWTVGRAGSGAAGGGSWGGRGGGTFARKPSGHASARTPLARLGRSTDGFGLPLRTWTTSTTLVLVPPPFRREAAWMSRHSDDAP